MSSIHCAILHGIKKEGIKYFSDKEHFTYTNIIFIKQYYLHSTIFTWKKQLFGRIGVFMYDKSNF